MRASELYAACNGEKCEGQERCHWCLAPCDQKQRHDDVPFLPFVKSAQFPKYPSGPWICRGCWLWRRTSLSIKFLDGTIKDRHAPMSNSWWFDDKEIFGLRKMEGQKAYDLLLKPPLKFCMTILTGDRVKNFIHLAEANEFTEIKANTPIVFTLDNIRMEYTVYELEEGLRHGVDGKMPGVRTLIEFFGKVELPPLPDNPRGRGRQHEIMVDRRNLEQKSKMTRVVQGGPLSSGQS